MNDTQPVRFGLRENLEILFRYKYRFLLVLCTSVLVAIAGAFLQSSVYESTVRIVVQQSRQQPSIGTALTPGNGTIRTEQAQLRTEIQIFQSSPVVDGLVDKLGAEHVLDRMRWRWDWLRELPGDIYASLKTSLVGEAPGPPVTPAKQAADKVREHLEAEPVRESDVFTVSFIAPDPAFAAEVANSLVDLYVDHHLAIRQGVQSSSVFAEEAQRLVTALRAGEERLRLFKQQHGIVAAGMQKQLLLQRSSDTEAALRKAEIETAETDSRIAEIKRQLATQSQLTPQSTTVSRTPMLDQLQRQLVEQEQERAQYVPGSAPARRLDEELALTRARLQGEQGKVANSQVSGINPTYLELQRMLAVEEGKRRALDSYGRLRAQAEQYRRSLAELDQHDLQLRELQRDVEITDEALRLYLKKREEARVSGVLDRKRISNVTPIERAEVPTRPVRPRKVPTVLIGLLAGLLGGLALAYFSEFVRRSFATREEAEQVLGRPVLAALPDTRQPHSTGVSLVESRRLAEVVVQAHRREGLRTLLIASSTHGEGKTHIGDALAQSLVQQGLRVLVVDTHLPTPPLAADPSSRPNVLAHLREGPHPRQARLRLADVAGGQAPPVAYEQLTLELRGLRDRFDIAVLDGPAASAEPEALWLVPAVDGVIAVVEAERTPALSASQTLNLIEGAGGKLIGVVLNKRRFVIPQWIYAWLLTPRPHAAAG